MYIYCRLLLWFNVMWDSGTLTWYIRPALIDICLLHFGFFYRYELVATDATDEDYQDIFVFHDI